MSTSNSSHLQWIDKLPEDSIRIPSYRSHQFENLYYSPSLKEFYQAPKTKYRRLAVGKSNFKCRNDNGTSTRISLKKLMSQLSGDSTSGITQPLRSDHPK